MTQRGLAMVRISPLDVADDRVPAARTVADVMKRDVGAVSPEMSVNRAGRVLLDQETRALPVVDRAGHVIGCESIIRAAAEVERGSPSHQPSTLVAACELASLSLQVLRQPLPFLAHHWISPRSIRLRSASSSSSLTMSKASDASARSSQVI